MLILYNLYLPILVFSVICYVLSCTRIILRFPAFYVMVHLNML
jgi:hypothetical protein